MKRISITSVISTVLTGLITSFFTIVTELPLAANWYKYDRNNVIRFLSAVSLSKSAQRNKNKRKIYNLQEFFKENWYLCTDYLKTWRAFFSSKLWNARRRKIQKIHYVKWPLKIDSLKLLRCICFRGKALCIISGKNPSSNRNWTKDASIANLTFRVENSWHAIFSSRQVYRMRTTTHFVLWTDRIKIKQRRTGKNRTDKENNAPSLVKFY